MAVTISDLSKTYPNGVKALKNVSLTIGNNMFGLLGPNGAGKSTLMRTIATLQDPDSGSVQLDGLDVLANKNDVRKVLGYLPQEFGVYPKMSAIDMLNHLAVMKGITSWKERAEMVDTLLEQTNLWDVRKKALSMFSGGMKQRFGIAQALLGNPRRRSRTLPPHGNHCEWRVAAGRRTERYAGSPAGKSLEPGGERRRAATRARITATNHFYAPRGWAARDSRLFRRQPW